VDDHVNGNAPTAAPPRIVEARRGVTFLTVRHDDLIPPPDPLRVAMDEIKLRELAESIRQFGFIMPLATTPVGDKYEIIDGHRRFCAGELAGIDLYPVSVWPDVESAKFGMMLHANIMREDVTAAEEGQQFVELANKHNWSMDELMRFFGRSEHYINRRAQLVSEFPDIAEHVRTRALTWTQADVIMRTKDESRRAYLLDQAVNNGATARNLMAMVDDFKRQDRLNAGIAHQPAPAEIYQIAPVEQPHCIWCARDDDQVNMELIPVHRYHRRDLETLLDQIGSAPRVAAVGDGGR